MFLRTVAIATGLLLVFTGIANSQRDRRLSGTTVSFTVGAIPVTVRTRIAIPAIARLNPSISLNGQIPTSCWADSQFQFECGWRGVLLIFSEHRSRAPATIRAVSLRAGSVRVFVRLSW